EQTDSDNDGDDFVHPKLSTHDDEARKDDEVNKEESNEESDEEVQGANTEDEEMDEEATHEEDEANELYRDVNINLEGRDTVMTDAQLPNVQATQEIEDTHVIITAPINPKGQQQSSSMSSGFVSNMLNPRTDTGIDSIFTLNTKATSLVDVSVTTIAEPPLVSAITLPPPPTPLITHMQQTPVPTPTTVSSSSLQNLPNFCIYLERDFKRLRLQDIEDMLILLVQGKLTNLNVKDRLAFGVSLRISDLKRKDAYTAYSNPKGFIYQNKDKKNKLMRIDELHKFSDGTLDDSDRERAKAMIQAIDKQLKSRRIMRSLERFVGGRPYEGDLQLLQRTI
ncbi:hypothetical protein Tco_1488033, partial [Tanacetum coccineum]